LPSEFKPWVLRDTTGPTWVIRQFVRALVQLAIPIALFWGFVHAPWGIKLWVIGAAGLPAILFQMGYSVPATEHRLLKAGYPPNTGEKTRAQRVVTSQIESNRRRRERIEARRVARQDRARR